MQPKNRSNLSSRRKSWANQVLLETISLVTAESKVDTVYQLQTVTKDASVQVSEIIL